jgi:hypothetical protein
MPPSVYQRSAWRNSNPQAAFAGLQTSALHSQDVDMDFDDGDADATADAVVANARLGTVSMVLPPGGSNAHMVADIVHLSADRRIARAQGNAARGITIDTTTDSLALAYLSHGEAHLELVVADAHMSDVDEVAPRSATELRRSTRTTKPSGSSALSSVTGPSTRSGSRTKSGGQKVAATPRWRVMLGAASRDEIAAVSAAALSVSQLRNSATEIIEGIPTWGHGASSLLGVYIKLSQLGLSSGTLPLARTAPQPICVWFSRENGRRITPAVLAACDKTYGKTLRKWIGDQAPAPATQDDPDTTLSPQAKWASFAVNGPRGLCLVVVGLVIWRAYMDSIRKTTDKDLQTWATAVADVTDIFHRILDDFAPPAHSDDGDGEVAGPSVVKRRRVAAPSTRGRKRSVKRS